MADWRTTLQPDDRQRIVNNIMETLKKDRKSSGSDELNKIATTFEKALYMASTSQSDYLRKVSTIQSNSAGSTDNPTDLDLLASIDSTAQTGHNAVDWQEECYQKIKSMKELYLSDLNDMYQKISIKCEQHNSVLNAPKSEQIERLKMFKNMLERTIQFLNVSKNNIVPAVKEKLSAYEKQIIGIINTNRPRQPVSAQQEIHQPGGHPLSMQPQQPQEQHQQQQQPDNQLNHQMQPTNMQNYASSSKQSTDVTCTSHGAMPLLSNHMDLSSAQTIQSISNTTLPKGDFSRGHNAVDWQEEIYLKIKTMKELYLSDLNDMYQKISIKCQQHDSVLNVPKSEQIERLKMFKNMLERTLQFLNVSKNNIVPAVKEKLSAYERQIVGILNSNRPRQPVSAPQEIQQPGGHPLSMQPQQPLEQPQQQPDNQMNYQVQPMNMQNSVSSSKQSTAVSTHHDAMPLLSNHMELLSAQTIQSISNTNMFKLQHLEHQKQELEQQFREWQMYQQWLNQQLQHVLQQQQQQQHLALQQQSVQLQATNQMSQLQVTPPLEISQQHSSLNFSPRIHHDHQQLNSKNNSLFYLYRGF